MRKFTIGEIVALKKFRVVIIEISEKKLKVIDHKLYQYGEDMEHMASEVLKSSVRKTGVFFLSAEDQAKSLK